MIMIIICACIFRNTLIKNNIMDSVPYTERRNAITMTVDTDTPEGR